MLLFFWFGVRGWVIYLRIFGITYWVCLGNMPDDVVFLYAFVAHMLLMTIIGWFGINVCCVLCGAVFFVDDYIVFYWVHFVTVRGLR